MKSDVPPTGAPTTATGARPRHDEAPRVSVVIPCYAQAHFLPEAIESALGQTHPDVEVVVVDDGSPDDTAGVAARYPSVRLLRQARGGLPAARNAGLATCHGTFVLFLDADDRLRPHAIEAGLRAFVAHPDAAFVAGHHVRMDAAGRFLEAPPCEPLGDEPYLAFLRGNPIGMPAAALYRRDAVEAARGFDPELRACEDYDLYLRIARHAPVAQHDAIVAEYRRHGANMSEDPAFMLRHALRVLRRQRPYVVADPLRRRAYRDGLRIWTDYYADAIERDLRAGKRVRRGLGTLLRYAPRRLARIVVGPPFRMAKRAVRSLIAARRPDDVPPVGTE